MQTTAPALATLARGQTLTRAFAAGDELFCASGTLQLNTSVLAGIDSLGLKIRDFTDEFNEHGQGQIARPPAAVVFTLPSGPVSMITVLRF